MYWDILSKGRKALLQEIVEQVDIGEYYMAGGTALSLQMGWRKSVDFDFFVSHPFNAAELYRQLTDISPSDIKGLQIRSKNTCDVLIRGVQVSFFEYRYPTLESPCRVDDMSKLSLAGIRDIAAMKAAAIGSRGAKKDFFDLYQICHSTAYSMENLLDDLHIKYGKQLDFSYIGMGLCYFDDAEDEVLPEVFVKYDWEEIKDFFNRQSDHFMSLLETYDS